MSINFYKFQGTGNDFVMVDNRNEDFPKLSQEQIAHICSPKTGVGADGFIKLNPSKTADFEMEYYNSDGNISSMCGNGGRCIVAFAAFLGMIKETCTFDAIDGKHEASILFRKDKIFQVKLKMIDVEKIEEKNGDYFLNTGSPHHVKFVEDTTKVNVFEEGRAIRNNVYGKAGANVNFVTNHSKYIDVRTYERGVEDETLSCGTGVTACAIAALYHLKTLKNNNKVFIKTKGGELQVYFDFHNSKFENVFLEGPATFVFHGNIEI
jgi:diaminopimelate epimerase